VAVLRRLYLQADFNRCVDATYCHRDSTRFIDEHQPRVERLLDLNSAKKLILGVAMATDISRRSFLRGDLDHEQTAVMRPPGATGQSFETLCETCDACQRVCPEKVIAMDADGRPVLDFAQAYCTMCGKCAEACPTGALIAGMATVSNWRARIDETCWSMNGISCRMCQDTCPASAIRFHLRAGGLAEPEIDVDVCSGCGGCSMVCPTGAVSFFRLPEDRVEDVA